MILAALAVMAQASAEPPILWYDAPTAEYMSGLPVGNGHIGAMVLGEPGSERLALNHNRLWRATTRNRTNPDGKAGLEEFRRLMFDGKVVEANRRAKELLHWQYDGVDNYQPAGDLLVNLSLDDPLRQYRRQIDLTTGIVTTTYKAGGNSYRQEVFASRPDGVIVYHLVAQADPGLEDFPIQGDIEISRIADPDCKVEPFWDGDSAGYTGRFPEGIEFTVASYWLGDKGETIGLSERSRPGASSKIATSRDLTLLIAMASSDSGGTRDQAEQILEKAVVKFNKGGGYEGLRSAQISAHRKLFNRVRLRLGPDLSDKSVLSDRIPTDRRLGAMKAGKPDLALQTLYFHYGRYLLMSSSAPGGLPANLQGLWNEDLRPPWWADYHTNININMNYWPAEVANLSECHDALFDWVDRAAKDGKEAAKALFGCRGAWIAQSLDAWAINRKQTGAWTEWVGAAPWLAQHYWWRYEFTGDKTFLRNRAYPLFKDVAAFFEDYLVPDSRPESKWKGRLVTVPSTSPENAYLFEGKRVDLSIGSTMDFELIHDLLTHAIRTAEILGVDAEKRAQWKRILEQIPPLQVGKHGQLQEWLEDHEEAEPGHRHFSHLFALFPGEQITLEKTPQLAAAARKSMERRLSHKGGHTGWSRSWLVGLYARLRDGDAAEEHLRHLITDFATISLLDLHPPRIFQIDGNFGGTAGIAEMLLQSHGGVIRLLPALPKAWPEGEVNGLVARGGVEIGIRWAKRSANSATLRSRRGGRFVVRAPTGQRIHSISAGGKTLPLSAQGRTSTEVAVTLPLGVPATVKFSTERAEMPKPKGYVCYRAASPPAIDGKLGDAAWKTAAWTEPFVDIEGDLKIAPRFRTRAKMLWDDRYFYIASEMEEPHVWGTLTKRDSVIFHDNDFEVFIDPDGDNHEYYELEVNPLNTVWDLRLVKPYRDGGPALNEWNIQGLKTAVHVDGKLNDARQRDQGWSVEMAIPWKALGEFTRRASPPHHGDQWRVNFSRVEWRHEIDDRRPTTDDEKRKTKNEKRSAESVSREPSAVQTPYRKVAAVSEDNWVWSPQGVIDMHRPERWGYVQFSSAKPGADSFRPDPSLAARDLLHSIYYAQKSFQEQHGRWSNNLEELGVSANPKSALTESLRIQAGDSGFTASVRFRKPRGSIRECRIRQDSLITCE